MKDRNFLKQAQDTVWNDPRWQPTLETDGNEITHCNQAALAVANAVGCHEFDPPENGEPYTADQLYSFFHRATSNFLQKDMVDVQALANEGSLVFAVCSSWLMQEKHGHIVSITPGVSVESASLKEAVPVCLNIAGKKYDARSIGINFAFPMHRITPQFFAWKESL